MDKNAPGAAEAELCVAPTVPLVLAACQASGSRRWGHTPVTDMLGEPTRW